MFTHYYSASLLFNIYTLFTEYLETMFYASLASIRIEIKRNRGIEHGKHSGKKLMKMNPFGMNSLKIYLYESLIAYIASTL